MKLLIFSAFALAIAFTIALVQPSVAQQACDPSYPDICIASPPPDLDCTDISDHSFRVVGADPHRFDGDKDGLGCE